MNSALIMAGGTGGHVFPALAVADALRAEGWQVQWLGTARGIESRLVPAAELTLHTISVQGLRGKGLLALLAAPVQLLRAVMQARAVIRRVRPGVVLGFGGFASGPGGLAARLQGLPLLIHEQNARAGTTNRLLAPIARRVLEAFRSGLRGAEQVGNPVRAAIRTLPAPAERFAGREGAIRVLVLGGSLGAQFFNETLPEALAAMKTSVSVVHQTGERWAEACATRYQSAGLVDAEVVPFIDDMAAAYGRADLVICRAGALTVSELACAGVAALLVPYPHAIDDHQTANAEWLAQAGAAQVCAQNTLTVAALTRAIESLCDRQTLLAMAEKARARAMPDATERVVAACQELVND